MTADPTAESVERVREEIVQARLHGRDRPNIAIRTSDADLLLTTLQAAKQERDEALDRIDELEKEAETVSAEFEKECWQAVRWLLEKVGHTDFDEGVSAQDAVDIIWEAIRSANSKAEAAEQECERLKGEISLLVACMDVQQDAFTEGYNKGQAKAEDKFVALRAALSAVPPSQGVEKLDMRKVVEALGFEPDNHHNALKCPYCTPEIAAPEPRSGDVVERLEAEAVALTTRGTCNVWDHGKAAGIREAIAALAASPVQGGAL